MSISKPKASMKSGATQSILNSRFTAYSHPNEWAFMNEFTEPTYSAMNERRIYRVDRPQAEFYRSIG